MLQVKRREWQFAGSTDVNAYYSQKVNGLFIPAAVLDKPFFSPEFDSARNYGSIGFSVCLLYWYKSTNTDAAAAARCAALRSARRSCT